MQLFDKVFEAIKNVDVARIKDVNAIRGDIQKIYHNIDKNQFKLDNALLKLEQME